MEYRRAGGRVCSGLRDDALAIWCWAAEEALETALGRVWILGGVADAEAWQKMRYADGGKGGVERVTTL